MLPKVTPAQRRLHLAAILFFAGLAVITLYPILTHTNTHTAGYDFFAYNWNFWWTRYALTQPDLSVFESNFVMFPAVTNYGFHTLTMFWFPLWATLEPFIGTLAAVNVILLLGCFLNGYVLFFFLRGEGVAVPLALLSGAALQVLPISRYFYYNTHLNLMDWFWLPLQLMLWKQIFLAVEARSFQRIGLWVGVQGVALWGLAHTDLQFPIFVSFLLAPYALLTLWRTHYRLQLIAAGLVTLALSQFLFWLAGPLPYMLRFNGTRVISPVEERPGIPFPKGFFTMSPTWWEWSTPTVGSFVTICFLVTLLYSLWKKPQPSDRWFWFVIMLPPLLLSWGADLKIAGVTIPLPYRLMYDFTDGMFRMPWRLAPVFLTAAAVFVGKSWWEHLPKRLSYNTFLYGGLFLLLAVSIRLFETAPLQPILSPYEFYKTIGQEEGDYGIVEVPTGAGTGEVLLGDPRAIQFQYYGITHQKRMVNGFIARAPLDHYWYLQVDDPMLAWLGGRRALEPATVRDQMQERIFTWTIGYFIIHQDYLRANGDRPEEIIGFLNRQFDLVCPWVVEHEAVVYRTLAHPGGCPSRIPPQADDSYVIDIGTGGDERFIGWGWHWAESVAGVTLRWAGDQPQTQVYLDLPSGAYEVTIAAQAFWEARELILSVNDIPLSETAAVMVDNLNTYHFTLPAEIVGEGQHLTLTLRYDGWHTPAEVLGSGDERKLAIAVDWIRFTPQ